MAQETKNEKHSQRLNLEAQLKSKDYVGNKLVEAIAGVLTAPSPSLAKLTAAVRDVLDKYPDYLDERQSMRDGINECWDDIAEIEASESEETEE